MTEQELLKFFEKTKKKKPFETGNSLHIYHERYRVYGYVVSLFYEIGDKTNTPLIEVVTKEEFAKPSALEIFSQRLKEGKVDTSKFEATCKKLGY